ncbi:MAG TPA: HEAT repeat domain-containing protein [Gemmatimonadales bacterium]|nr:HEAT repeat domain-containing protein [Gemmatimonadales bacterium]
MIVCTRFPTRFVCSGAGALVALLLAGAPSVLPAQQDEALVGQLARLLAISDARVFDEAVLRGALGSDNPGVRRQAALAAGRIGDPQAVGLLLPVLNDSNAAVAAAAAFALGLLRDASAVEPLLTAIRTVAPDSQGLREQEAVSAIARIGGPSGVRALQQLLEGVSPTRPPTIAITQALLEAWRLGRGAPTTQLLQFADASDLAARSNAAYSLSRLRPPSALPTLLRLINDQDTEIRATAARGLVAALADTARMARPAVTSRLRPLLGDAAIHVRINALRAISTYRGDSTLVPAVVGLVGDANIGVAVQAETTLGTLGGSRAVEVLRGQLSSPTFALRRQAVLALGEADSAAGTAAAQALTGDADWRWRAVAAEGFAAAQNRARLEGLLADGDGRVVAAALQGLVRVVKDSSDTALVTRARSLAGHPDPTVRSVAADILGRAGMPEDVDRLTEAYRRAAADPINDARLSAVSALAAIAQRSAGGRLRVVNQFVSTTPRSDDYLVRRLVAERFPDAAESWGAPGPVVTGRTEADYREVVRTYLLPGMLGQDPPVVTIETDRGNVQLEMLPVEAPLTVAAFLTLVDRRYFDGLRWHRIVPNFVIQDGDPRGDGWGGPGYSLRDEINPVRYAPGVVGMALSGPDTGGSQYFIALNTAPHLDGIYTVFGRVRANIQTLEAFGMGDRIRSAHR